MSTVLLVDDDTAWIVCLTDYLNVYASHVNVLTASNGEQAIEIIKANSVDLVMTDLRMPKMDGFELLSYLNRIHPEVAAIITSALNESDVSERLNNSGHYQYLQKPIELKRLTAEITTILSEDSRGFVHGFTLANFLQLVEMEKKTCTLKVKSKGKVGYLYIENGELIEAETSSMNGVEAALRIIGWESADTQIQRFKKKKRSINEKIIQLLLKTSSRNDQNWATVTHENMLEEAIVQAEGHHFKQAMGLLARLLKMHPRSHHGWLWYSRTSENMKSIRNGIRNAAKLAPKDPEIAEDVSKLESVEDKLSDEWIKHCPICWCPIQVSAQKCDYCSSYLQIRAEAFTCKSAGNIFFLDQAEERYHRMVARENSADGHYYLSVIHLNHKNWSDALHHLDTAVRLSPDNQKLSKQLATLLNHLASGIDDNLPVTVTNEKKSKSGTNLSETGKRQILVVENSATTRKVISVTLGQRGFDVLEAGDGLEALSKMHDSRPELVLLDVVLPKMDGYKVLELMKEDNDLNDIPVIILTSKDGFFNKVKGKTSGCVAYLTKPFDPGKLAEIVEKYVNVET